MMDLILGLGFFESLVVGLLTAGAGAGASYALSPKPKKPKIPAPEPGTKGVGEAASMAARAEQRRRAMSKGRMSTIRTWTTPTGELKNRLGGV